MKIKDTRIWFFILAIVAIVLRTWVTEDAYITFRHIDNFFAGNGLVFNKGERVEGFTHPVWAFLIIGLRAIGIQEHLGAILLGYFFSLGGIYLLLKYSGKSAVLLSVALLVSHQGFADFSTAGMETSLTFFLICHLFYEIVPANFKSPAKVGLILALLYLNRPEFGLLVFYYSVYMVLLAWKMKSPAQLVLFLLPVLVVAGGYHVFRWVYYQDIFPNTYYAKSGGGSNYIQGFKYLLHFTFYSWLLVPYVLFWGYALFRRRKIRSHEIPLLYRDLGAISLMVFYIVRVGGDFMAFRLLLPSYYLFVIITAYYLQKWWLHELPAKRVLRYNIVLLVLAIVVRFGFPEAPLIKMGVVNERLAYTKDLNQGLVSRMTQIKYHWFFEGEKMGELQKCIGYEKFVITNSVTQAKCSPGVGLGYYSVAAGTNVNVIDELGLTDKNIAKQKRIENFRVGHERSVGLDYLIAKGTLFCSLESPQYNELMDTPYGVIISLDPEFLFRLGFEEYRKKTSGLKLLYMQNEHANKEEGRRLFQRLKQLEKQYGQTILSLPAYPPSGYEKYDKCWKKETN